MSPERDGQIAGEFKRLAQGNCCLQLIRATETTPCSKYEKVLIVSPPISTGALFLLLENCNSCVPADAKVSTELSQS